MSLLSAIVTLMESLRSISVESVEKALAWFSTWLPRNGEIGRTATVLCAAARAHALRRLVAVDQRQVGRLTGVRFLDPGVFACELLARAGEPRRRGWEEVRRLRIHHCFDAGAFRGRLRYFDADQLRSGRGYADAFARVIGDLEAAGLSAGRTRRAAGNIESADALAADRLHDVATVWAAVDTEQGNRRSLSGLLADAAAAAHRRPDLVAPFRPIATFVTRSPSSVLLQLLAALSNCDTVLLDARPIRATTQRWRDLLSPPGGASDAGRSASAANVREHARELDLVRTFLFAPSEVVADPARPRSPGPDGTVDVEEHPSIEDEIDATALWVSEQIDGGLALEDVAVVVPALDPHAHLIVDRLSRTLLPGGPAIPAYVAGGLALAQSPAGLRFGNLLRALERGLDAETTLAVLPSLRRDGDDERPLSPSRAAAIVYGAGIVGGSPGDVGGALEWLPRLIRRRDALRERLGELPEVETGEPEQRRHLYTRRDAERWLADVEPLLPPIEALQQLAAAIIAAAPLRELWAAVRRFATAHLRVPPVPPNWLGLLDEQLEPVLSDQAADTVSGFAAVTYLAEALARTRIAHGRFGEPRVFVGTAESAAGLPFRAVRVTGLAEGIVPRTPHDDPIVPNDVRVRLEETSRPHDRAIVVPRLEDDVLEDLHAFFRVVGGTRERLCLSVSRQWVDRSEREVSGLMLEVAAALGRRAERSSGEPASEGDVPTAARLRSAYYAPGREARSIAAQQSLQPRAALAHLPVRRDGCWRVPASWCSGDSTRLDRVQSIAHALDATSLAAIDGLVTTPWLAVRAPGLSPERPISASAVTILLGCPHRFLLQHVLHFEESTVRPSTDTIDARPYGSLFHAVAEAFFRAHGTAVCARDGSLEQRQEQAAQIAAAKFDDWCAEYPLRGEDSIRRERRRLVQQISQLVVIEWQMAKRAFVDAELSFGDPLPVRLSVAGGDLYVRGQIDRVDRLRDQLSVRDLKTGRVHDFREEPLNCARDLQIGLYTLALEAGSPAGPRVGHAAYVHPSAAQEPERGFQQSDLETLRQRTREWLGVARGLLATGAFPRTPLPEDCRYCPFQPACGEGAQARSAAKLASDDVSPEVAAFVRLKRQEQRDSDG